MQGVPHHLIDILDFREDFDVALFCKLAKEAMEEIYAAGDIPILAGGTGFYLRALLYDTDFGEQEADGAFREEMQRLADTHGAEYLHEKLREVDPEGAEAIHPNNVKRVIRALEFHHLTGEPISAHNERERGKKSPYDFAYFLIDDDRKALYERIDKRVDLMLEAGLEEEVRALWEAGLRPGMTAMQGLGYKEWIPYFEGKCSRDEVAEIIKRDTRHFAKRQLTWFRREENIIRIYRPEYPDEDAMAEEIYKKAKHLCKP